MNSFQRFTPRKSKVTTIAWTTIALDIFVGSDRYTSPNRETIRLPVPSNHPLPQNPLPTELCNWYWADDRYPYLPLIFERERTLYGPLMGRFSTFSLTSLQHDHHGWHLPRATAKDRKTFERLLRQMGEHLHCFLMKTFPHIECIWTIPANPGSYGYFEGHKSQDEAFAAVKDSIRAFVLYAAYISFLIGLFHCHQRPGDWVNYTTSTRS